MKMTRANILKFRGLENVGFKIGSRITVIAGHNRTGKSTILALLGHTSQLSRKTSKAKPIIKSSFSCEWSEIFKQSPNDKNSKSPYFASIYFHKNESDIIADDLRKAEQQKDTISLDKNMLDQLSEPYDVELKYRATWQEDSQRFRILPASINGKNTASKLDWPTLYLGLSRLYPVGESSNAEISKSNLSKWYDDLRNGYNQILGIKLDQIKDVRAVKLQENKQAVGIENEEYDSYSNSAGEDNIGQIILALSSFKDLKAHLGDKWNGGMLLIDEIDATLHAKSQIKLFEFLSKISRDLEIQIVFTTHSLSLLQHISSIVEHNSDETINDYELVYLTRANGPVSIFQNISYQAIYNDMHTSRSTDYDFWRQVTLYTEDDESRWVITKLIPEHLNRIKLPEIKMGCSNLLDLLSNDYRHFSTHLFVVDGDVKDSVISSALRRSHQQKFHNLLKLPGNNKSIEEILYIYLCELDREHEIFHDRQLFSDGYTRASMIDDFGPFSSKYSDCSVDREKFKAWFNDNLPFLDVLFDYWKSDNRGLCQSFYDQFKSSFNYVAGIRGVSKIQ